MHNLIDPKKKEVVLQRIKDGKEPFCAEKPEPEKPRPSGDVPTQRYYLFEGAKSGSLADVKKAIEKLGADINMRDENGNTALMTAAYNGHAAVVAYLMGKGADLFAKNKEGLNASELASKSRNGTIRVFIDSAMKVAKGE